MTNLLITTSSFGEYSTKQLKLLESAGYNISLNNKGRKLTKSEITEIIPDYECVIAGTEDYDKDVLNNALNLKIISRLGVGLDNIDLAIASEKNIKVTKTEISPSTAVAELTLGLILDLLRKITYQNQMVKKNKWKKKMGYLLNNKVIGIIGLGEIGKEFVRISKGFNLKFLACDLIEDKNFAEKNNIKYCSIEYMISNADILSLHLSMHANNHNLIDYNKLLKMKSNAIIINTSRGGIINENDLAMALDNKIILGAGLDVYNEEPYQGILTKYDNVITTPHIGSYAIETRNAMELEAAQNIINYLN